MDLFFLITTFIQESIASIGVGLVGGWILYKRLVSHSDKETLESTKAKAETSVIRLITDRLTALEETNNNLSRELNALRQEHSATITTNLALQNEIRNLKSFIEQNFRASYNDSTF